MAEAKTINTRIVLRNDLSSKWMTSDKALLKGEAALALRSDGNYEIRFGASDSLSTWSMLEDKGQLIVPARNVEYLTYDEYRLSSLDKGDKEARFQLQGKNSKTQVWSDIGSAIEIPNVDLGPLSTKIDTVSANLCAEIKALSTSLSTSVDSLVSTTKSNILSEVKAVSAETLISAAADAKSKADAAESAAKSYSNELCTSLSTTVDVRVEELKELIAGGIHFVGKVNDISTDTSVTPNKGYYQLVADGEWTLAKNGDLVIKNSIEYVWSSTTQKWEQFGDEGDWATKAYVDQAAADALSSAKEYAKGYTDALSAAEDAKIAQEATDRDNAISALKTEMQSVIDLSVSNLETKIATVDQAVTTEETARKAADDVLSTKIDNEITARTAAVSNLSTSLSTTVDALIAATEKKADDATKALSTSLSNTVDAKETALKTDYLPANYQAKGDYLSAGVANSPDASDKLMKRTEVEAKINALDVATKTLAASKTIKTIGEEDGKISVEIQDIAISQSQVDGLTAQVDVFEKQIASLATISANHETRLTAAEGDIDTLQADVAGLKTISSDLSIKIDNEITARTAAVSNLSTSLSNTVNSLIAATEKKADDATKALSTSLSNTVNAKIKNITDNYALSADVTAISGNLFTKIVNDVKDLSTSVSSTVDAKFVKYTDVKTTVTLSNKIVTESDIAKLESAMHFRGVTTDSNVKTGYEGKPSDTTYYKSNDPIEGDVILNTTTSQEFVFSGTYGSGGKWYEIGAEQIYAKQEDFVAHRDNLSVHITDAERAAWNAKQTAEQVSSIANAYRGIEETRATGIESGLRTDVNAISAQVKDYTNEWKAAVDLSVENLSAYAKTVNDNLNTEIERAKAAEAAISADLSGYALSADVTAIKNALESADSSLQSDIDGKVTIGTGTFAKDATSATYVATQSDLSIIKIDDADYQRMLSAGKLDDDMVYIISSEYVSGHNKRIVDVADAISATDAVNKSVMEAAIEAAKKAIIASTLSGVNINGVDFEVVNNVAYLSVDYINCGTAD